MTTTVAAGLDNAPLKGTVRCAVGVIGLGYAGLPQAVAFAAAGHVVLGVDTDSSVTATVSAGHSPVETVRDEQIAEVSGLLTVSECSERLRECSAVLVCVPTPLDDDGLPDLRALRAAAGSVAARLVPGQLIVVESTVHPGATDEVVKPILEATGLVAGVDFNLAFAPERVDPGNAGFPPFAIPKVIGGLTSVCARRTVELYRGVVSEVHVTRGLREAEAAKILENTYRQVNLALAHEFAAYCAVKGIDVTAAIDAAATKPFGFHAFYPGAGVGGHCIPVDPMYLATSAREAGVPVRLVELAQRINAKRPRQVVDQCRRMLEAAGASLRGARVLVLGLSYKPDVPDPRNTPAEPIVRLLTGAGAVVSVHDPRLSALMVGGTPHSVVGDVGMAVRSADAVVLLQRHREYTSELLRGARMLHIADCRVVAEPDR
ncbi:nucleotide sugar dehydrogenase [Allokutzneria sp. A3M-2-11 16]|uniref:nucleotide sugar dehydrogenase n=1 Tax=Allokutzneria sp. A3M-2-11 16 TaxID=2962043 RepID=UPI0020B8A755|nr:nucleotide sugar dehydrogenase [Allokutzneria sp. A3M-2-11 16]MCP3798462.1 nucleotide sugar dehydrogenase [Allokutzneria sp. A3M-2-11 16]